MLRIIRFIFLLLIVIVGLSFAVLNAETVSLNYYLGSWQAPLSLILVVALALGALFGVLACLSLLLGLKRELAKLRKAAKLSEQEVKNLRAIPLKGTHNVTGTE